MEWSCCIPGIKHKSAQINWKEIHNPDLSLLDSITSINVINPQYQFWLILRYIMHSVLKITLKSLIWIFAPKNRKYSFLAQNLKINKASEASSVVKLRLEMIFNHYENIFCWLNKTKGQNEYCEIIMIPTFFAVDWGRNGRECWVRNIWPSTRQVQEKPACTRYHSTWQHCIIVASRSSKKVT